LWFGNLSVPMTKYDAILILGGGVRDGGELPPHAAARFDLALERQTGEPLVCLSAGTTHRPPPLEDGFPIAESVAGARYLMARGIDSKQIRIEIVSYDTIGNAYLTKLIHVDPPGWEKLLVITSAFHMPRSRAIFQWVFGLDSRKYQLDFEESPDTGITPEALQFRREKEAQALAGLTAVRARIPSLRELHEWLFTDHQAYSAAGRWKQERARDPRVLESY
jgi:hypothetical protein